jgi:hypothetical protein
MKHKIKQDICDIDERQNGRASRWWLDTSAVGLPLAGLYSRPAPLRSRFVCVWSRLLNFCMASYGARADFSRSLRSCLQRGARSYLIVVRGSGLLRIRAIVFTTSGLEHDNALTVLRASGRDLPK